MPTAPASLTAVSGARLFASVAAFSWPSERQRRAVEELDIQPGDRMLEARRGRGRARDVHDELRAIWTSLRPSQRRVLAAIAENTQRLYAADRRHGGSRGGAVRSATKALEDRGEISGEQAATGYRVTDPMLARWVRAGRPEA